MKREVYRDKPFYEQNPIGSLQSLAYTLNTPLVTLKDIAKNVVHSYHEFEIPVKKKDGSVKLRKIKEPKFLLKKIQKRINAQILSKVNFPNYLHGGIRKRDYFSNAESHVKSETVISLDIENFYPNIDRNHVLSIFKYLLKFEEKVSAMLADLVTFEGKLPQGAVTSSYIANLIFYEKEYKIVSGFRQQGLIYTRLLDDITVSSQKKLTDEKKKSLKRFVN